MEREIKSPKEQSSVGCNLKRSQSDSVAYYLHYYPHPHLQMENMPISPIAISSQINPSAHSKDVINDHSHIPYWQNHLLSGNMNNNSNDESTMSQDIIYNQNYYNNHDDHNKHSYISSRDFPLELDNYYYRSLQDIPMEYTNYSMDDLNNKLKQLLKEKDELETEWDKMNKTLEEDKKKKI